MRRKEEDTLLAKKVAAEKKYFEKKFTSGIRARFFAWDVAREFGVNPSISVWKNGRYVTKCEMRTNFFEFVYDPETKIAIFNFFEEGKEVKTIEQIQKEIKLKDKKEQLLPKEIYSELDKQGDLSLVSSDKIKVIAKLFNASGVGTWYIYDYEKEDPDTLWCFANLGMPEFAECGTVSLTELAEFEGMFGIGVERDKFFTPREYTLQEIIDKVKKGEHV